MIPNLGLVLHREIPYVGRRASLYWERPSAATGDDQSPEVRLKQQW
jgi:hypothetical protein